MKNHQIHHSTFVYSGEIIFCFCESFYQGKKKIINVVSNQQTWMKGLTLHSICLRVNHKISYCFCIWLSN